MQVTGEQSAELIDQGQGAAPRATRTSQTCSKRRQ